MSNIVLIGYRGAGKTTVGRLLAQRLRVAFVDTDEIVVRDTGKSIAAIFADGGEPAFRELEAQAIAEATARPSIVLSAGGGAVLREDNVRRLRDCGSVFWLDADAETLWGRIREDAAAMSNRPALTDHTGFDEVSHVLAERVELYRACAHHRVDVSSITPAETVDAVLSFME